MSEEKLEHKTPDFQLKTNTAARDAMYNNSMVANMYSQAGSNPEIAEMIGKFQSWGSYIFECIPNDDEAPNNDLTDLTKSPFAKVTGRRAGRLG